MFILDSLRFLSVPPDSGLLYIGAYNPTLVSVSILIAVFASYTALQVGGLVVVAASRKARWLWLLAGSLALGSGIWAMHFVGMIAFSLPCSVGYDPTITAISVVPGILASAVALKVISQRKLSRKKLIIASALLAGGIGTMHYTGMAALQLDGLLRYNPALFVLSLLVALGLALAALWLRSALSEWRHVPRVWVDFISAVVMGCAVSGMHYSGMAAAYFIRDGDIPAYAALNPTALATIVSTVTAFLIALALFAAVASRYLNLFRRLQSSEREIGGILETTQEGFWMLDTSGVITKVNPALCKILKRRREDILGKSLFEFSNEANEAAFMDVLRDSSRGESSTFEAPLLLPDGSGVPCLFNATPIMSDEEKEWEGIFALITDLSGRKQQEAYMRQAVAVLENTAEGVVIADLAGKVVSVNPAFTRVTGYTRGEAVGQTLRLLQSGRHDTAYYHQMWSEINSTGHWQGEIWNRRKNGEIYPEWLTISEVRDEKGLVQNYVGIFSDISHIKHSEEKLERLAHFDPLTGLPNRTVLSAQLGHALGRAQRHNEGLAVMILDLDGFKTVNDSLGHPAGDLLLQTIAQRLRNALREDDLVARLGGDEFAIVLESSHSMEFAGTVAEKVIKVVSEPLQLGEHSAMVTASVGIATFPGDGSNITDLLKAADTAMYAAKQGGRNAFRFHHAAMAEAAAKRMELEHGLRQALAQNQLELWYQPLVSLASGQAIGAEALLRWRGPQGMVSPADFIPVAEETGLILPLGEWVLRRACQDAKRWQDAGLAAGQVSVNVSGPQIERGNFVETVATILAESGLPPAMLQLEITESFLLRNAEQALEVVRQLSETGVTIAIDDFGTGYSSLAYLKYLRASKLKIDRSFVHDLPDDKDSAAIARAVIALGKTLGFVVLAEGVESVGQRDFLLQEGCHEAQGYLYSRPLPPDQFDAWLKNC